MGCAGSHACKFCLRSDCKHADLKGRIHRSGAAEGKKALFLPVTECCWIKLRMVGQFEFFEWTADGHLRHSRFIAIRDDKRAQDVKRE